MIFRLKLNTRLQLTRVGRGGVGLQTVALLSLALTAPCAFSAQGVGAGAAQAPGRAAIRLEQVVAALASARVPLEGAAVKLLVQMTAASDAPRMEVRSIEPWGERRARIRMACVDHVECLPFYVSAEWPTVEAASAALAVERQALNAPTQPATGTAHGSVSRLIGSRASAFGSGGNAGLAFGSANAQVAGSLAKEQIVLHAGAHATLLMDGERLHIKVPVVCLENGAAGRTIRVAALDHRQTYVAEVVDGTLLKANL